MDLLLIASISICLVIVGGLQYRAFGEAGKTRTPDNIVSFFFVRDITERWQRNILAIVAATPLTFAFVILAREAKPISLRLLEYQARVDEDWKGWKGITDVLKEAPEAVFPLFLLLLLYFVLGAQLKFLFERFDRCIVYISGIGLRTNKVAWQFSSFLLNKYNYEQILAKLEQGGKRLPLPEELEHANDDLKVSFQLLHLAKPNVRDQGLGECLAGVVSSRFPELANTDEFQNLLGPGISRFGIAVSRLSNLKWSQMSVGLTMFVIVCGLYIVLVPMAHEHVASPGIGWPVQGKFSSLSGNVLSMSLGTVFAMIVGVLLYARRADDTGKMSLQALMGVVAIVFLLSLTVYSPYVLVRSIEHILGLTDGVPGSLIEFKHVVYIFGHSLVPCLGVLVLAVIDPEDILSRWDILVMILVVSVGHILAYAAFEFASGSQDPPFYWHQGLLAAVLTATALVILSVYWKGPKPIDGALQSSNTEHSC